jgi:hypothetical protein
MHGIPEIVPITPHVLSQSDGHRWGTWPALLVQALMRQHTVVEVDHQPHPRLVLALTRRAAPGAAAQGGAQTAEGPIPALHEGGVDGRAQPPVPQFPKAAARAAVDDPRDDPEELALGLTPRDDLAIAQVPWGDQAWLGMAPAGAAAAALGDPPQDLHEGGRVGSPASAQPHGQAAQARHHWRDPQGRTLLGARAPVYPQDAAAAHGDGAMPPLDAGTTPFGVQLVQLHPRNLQVPRDRRVVCLGPLGSDALEAMHGLDVDPTEVGRARVAHAPPLTLQQPLHGLFGQFAAFHQGASAHRELLPARRAAQPFTMPVLAGP